VSDLPPPRNAYRGAAMLHAVLAIVILVVAVISGTDLLKALAVAAAYFVAATGWSWFRFRQRAGRVTGRGPNANQGGDGQ
jgi:hypothetical protein